MLNNAEVGSTTILLVKYLSIYVQLLTFTLYFFYPNIYTFRSSHFQTRLVTLGLRQLREVFISLLPSNI